ncbi:pyridoxal phosphate-dependent aminotransferase [Patescibacteria group bacterium]|nr:pyridoxal phosphate-dependent aminotransferase [Patescibacteria group bacterium]
MILTKVKMEEWFIKTASCKYNFSESGVPDFTMAEFFQKIKANKSVLDNIFLGNNSTWGSLDLRKKISRAYEGVKPNDVIATSGTSEALYIFFNLFLNSKSKVLLLHPAFPLLYLIPRALKAKVHFLDALRHNNKAELLEKLIFKINNIKPNLLIINIPHNPLGFTFSKKEIIEIAKAAKKNKTDILFDEHYRFLPINTSKKIFFSGYGIVKKFYDRVFATGSVIKCAGIVGIRVGWMIADRKTLGRIRDYKDYTTHCVPLISETITGLAISNINKIAKDYIRNIKDNWFALKNSRLVKERKIILNYELEGGCVCFPGISGINTFKLAEILAKEYSISIMPGEVFGKSGYIRINLSQKPQEFKNFLEKINNVIKKYGKT